jgi:hypothetical protein
MLDAAQYAGFQMGRRLHLWGNQTEMRSGGLVILQLCLAAIANGQMSLDLGSFFLIQTVEGIRRNLVSNMRSNHRVCL